MDREPANSKQHQDQDEGAGQLLLLLVVRVGHDGDGAPQLAVDEVEDATIEHSHDQHRDKEEGVKAQVDQVGHRHDMQELALCPVLGHVGVVIPAH